MSVESKARKICHHGNVHIHESGPSRKILSQESQRMYNVEDSQFFIGPAKNIFLAIIFELSATVAGYKEKISQKSYDFDNN